MSIVGQKRNSSCPEDSRDFEISLDRFNVVLFEIRYRGGK
jgi:hypothetical protein